MFQNNFWLNNQGNGGFMVDLVNGEITGNLAEVFSATEHIFKRIENISKKLKKVIQNEVE